jgi:hypothetical protein
MFVWLFGFRLAFGINIFWIVALPRCFAYLFPVRACGQWNVFFSSLYINKKHTNIQPTIPYNVFIQSRRKNRILGHIPIVRWISLLKRF